MNDVFQTQTDQDRWLRSVLPIKPKQVQKAQALSDTLNGAEVLQWQTYIKLLAFHAFKRWWRQQGGNVPLVAHASDLLSPCAVHLSQAIPGLTIGETVLCLLITEQVGETLSVPRAVIELGEWAAHLYLLLEVQEEARQVIYHGYLRHDQLVNELYRVELQAAPDWTCAIPLDWFYSNEACPDLTHLPLYIQHLQPHRLVLPAPVDGEVFLPALQPILEQHLSPLRTCGTELWQVLSWEQGRVMLTQPALLQWMMDWQRESVEHQPWAITHLRDIVMALTQQSLNIATWLRDEVTDLAHTLSWILLPAFSPETVALRSPAEELEAIVTGLRHQGEPIPPRARGAYRDLRLKQIPLRLYTLVWSDLSADHIPEWSLQLILGAPPETALPDGICLQVQDQTGASLTRQFRRDGYEFYPTIRATGTWDEEFSVQIALDEAILSLPPFSFHPA